MGFRSPIATISTVLLLIGTTAIASLLSALLWISPAAAITQLKITNVGYKECPPEVAEGSVTSGGGIVRSAKCFLVYGTVKNGTSKSVIDADVYGRIYDAYGETVMQNRTRLGSIDEVPPGKSEFSIRISVPDTQPEPLQLKQFKASGFTARVRLK